VPKKRPKKPTGITGTARFGGPETSEFVRAKLPDDQRAVEQLAVDYALRDGPKSGCDLNAFYGLRRPPKQREPPGHDFDLDTVAGPQSLELITVAKGPFGRARLAFVRGDRIADLLQEVMAKSVYYGGGPRKTLHLLIYSTDFRFHLDDDDIKLLALDLSRITHVFTSVVYYDFGDGQDGSVRVVFPAPAGLLEGLDYLTQRGVQISLGDLPNLIPIPQGFVVKLAPPPQKPGPGPGVVRVRMRSEPPNLGEQPPERGEP
jgi:hypothetical protein